jgi:alcohol/geraniol dehydrogenase (NADP+)
MTMIRGWAVHAPKEKLELFTFDAEPLGTEEVEIDIEHCCICHADLSMIKNEWGMSQYPLIPGHEVVGKISALGDHAKNLEIGQRVGIGWNAISCMHCHEANIICVRKQFPPPWLDIRAAMPIK